jgi:hypothetical protein
MSNEKRKITQNPFPSDTEERLNAVLSSVNIEPKSILITKCLDGEAFRNRADLASRYRQWAGWPRDAGNFESYSHQTLVPIGMVAEEERTVFEPLRVEAA